ncbi:MAG: VOC family protein [Pseudomonadota bacterium]
MIAAIAPQFFSTDIPRTVNFFERMLGFEHQFGYGDPVYFVGVIRDGQSIFIRHVDSYPIQPADKYTEELLDAYLRVEEIEALYREYADRGVPMHRELATMPWGFTEFVVRDGDGRLLCFGEAADVGT